MLAAVLAIAALALPPGPQVQHGLRVHKASPRQHAPSRQNHNTVDKAAISKGRAPANRGTPLSELADDLDASIKEIDRNKLTEAKANQQLNKVLLTFNNKKRSTTIIFTITDISSSGRQVQVTVSQPVAAANALKFGDTFTFPAGKDISEANKGDTLAISGTVAACYVEGWYKPPDKASAMFIAKSESARYFLINPKVAIGAQHDSEPDAPEALAAAKSDPKVVDLKELADKLDADTNIDTTKLTQVQQKQQLETALTQFNRLNALTSVSVTLVEVRETEFSRDTYDVQWTPLDKAITYRSGYPFPKAQFAEFAKANKGDILTLTGNVQAAYQENRLGIGYSGTVQDTREKPRDWYIILGTSKRAELRMSHIHVSFAKPQASAPKEKEPNNELKGPLGVPIPDDNIPNGNGGAK